MIKMYNRVNDEANYIIDAPLQEDVNWDIQTNYQDTGDLFPSGFDQIIGLLKTNAQISKSASKPLEDIMSQPIWNKTEPLRISTSLVFYTKTDPYEDVMLPAISLCSLNVVRTRGNSYGVPGITFEDAKILSNNSQSADFLGDKKYEALFAKESSSTVCSVRIPGVIFMPIALILASKPIFSKEVTLDKLSNIVYPLWAKVDIEIRSITPASLELITSELGGTDQFFNRINFNRR